MPVKRKNKCKRENEFFYEVILKSAKFPSDGNPNVNTEMRGMTTEELNKLRCPLIQQYNGVTGLDINHQDSHGMVIFDEAFSPGRVMAYREQIRLEKEKEPDWKDHYKEQLKYACMFFYAIFIKTPIDFIKSYLKKEN